MAQTPTSMLSPADQERRRALRTMKAVALGALIFMAVMFCVAFVLQREVEGWGYVRAAAEGGMVGALADWFAVTALFRHPFGIPIPHTAIIPNRKDEIGQSLGEFVETNFLSGEIVEQKLSTTEISRRLGSWLRQPDNAKRVGSEGATMGANVLRALSDDDVQDLIGDLARDHLLNPQWGPPAGGWLEKILEVGAHHGAVDLAIDNIATWLQNNKTYFEGLLSKRLPGWVPSLAHRFVDDTAYKEAVKFVTAVQSDPQHQARKAIDDYLAKLADNLQNDPETIAKLEEAKSSVFDSPRVRSIAADAWNTVKNGLLEALENPASTLRLRIDVAIQDFGMRLDKDEVLQHRFDSWITNAAVFLVERYKHDIASIITDTVERWDARETTEKIELMVGKDLQFIRLNGTIVGALAGVVIYTIAHAVLGGA